MMRASGEEATLRSAKPPFTGSNPVSPSISVLTFVTVHDPKIDAGVAESADATDLKSVGG